MDLGHCVSLPSRWTCINWSNKILFFFSYLKRELSLHSKSHDFIFLFPRDHPCGSAGKESTCNVGDLGLIPGLGRCPEEGKGYPFQYSCLENSMNCIVHKVAKSWTRLSYFHSLRDHPAHLPLLISSPSHSESPICMINWGFPGGTSG